MLQLYHRPFRSAHISVAFFFVSQSVSRELSSPSSLSFPPVPVRLFLHRISFPFVFTFDSFCSLYVACARTAGINLRRVANFLSFAPSVVFIRACTSAINHARINFENHRDSYLARIDDKYSRFLSLSRSLFLFDSASPPSRSASFFRQVHKYPRTVDCFSRSRRAVSRISINLPLRGSPPLLSSAICRYLCHRALLS